MTASRRITRHILCGISALALAACDEFDPDLRGATGGFSTAGAAQQTSGGRPAPDTRGVITYSNYQVAVARRGDTVADVANRLGTDGQALASFNGLPIDSPLREGEVIALPNGAGIGAAQNPSAAAPVDVTTLAGQAINQSPATPSQTTASTAPAAAPVQDPIRHKVERGETAFSVARLYNVSVRSLAEWNGLGPQFSIREGQFLLIPVANAKPPTTVVNTAPGQGTPTPTPPSAQKPLPKDDTAVAAAKPKPSTPAADLGPATKSTPEGRFAFPVNGTIIRDYTKGKNENINIKGAPGDAVKAADNGTVAAITESAEGVPIIVVRHQGNLLTVYANVTDVLVKKGDSVRRGQGLAKLRAGDQSFVHFEVREGFDSVDPNNFLNG